MIIVFTILLCNPYLTSGDWSNGLGNTIQSSSSLSHQMTEIITSGREAAKQECAKQFQYDVWSCPVTDFNRKNMMDNRETAFVNAITAAGIAHSVSKDCSKGSLTSCGCRHKKVRNEDKGSWQWGGCNDNLSYGELISKQLLDLEQVGSVAKLHNNQVGRIAVKKAMRKQCKCHGMSGSCTLQTCWEQLGDFKHVGRFLKKQYKRAAKVDLSNGILHKLESRKDNSIVKSVSVNSVTNRGRRTSGTTKEMKINKRKLVFLQPSPDYCRLNPKLGYKGAARKTCEVDNDSAEKEDVIRKCSNLCSSCGLHARKTVVMVEGKCDCKFNWCCSVTCSTCKKIRVRVTCTH